MITTLALCVCVSTLKPTPPPGLESGIGFFSCIFLWFFFLLNQTKKKMFELYFFVFVFFSLPFCLKEHRVLKTAMEKLLSIYTAISGFTPLDIIFSLMNCVILVKKKLKTSYHCLLYMKR